MSTQVQFRRGTTANMNLFAGAVGEITVDTTKKVVVVHDGSTLGGNPMAPANNPSFTGTVTLQNALGVAHGGTGLTSLTAGYIPYGNGTGAFSSSSGFVFDGSNLGLGVTPSAKFDVQTATNKRIQFADASHSTLTNLSSAITFSRGNDGVVGLSAIFGWNNGGIALAGREGITFATGGAAGYSATVQAMTLDASGRLGVGVASPSYVVQAAAAVSGYWNNLSAWVGTPAALSISNTQNGGYDAAIIFQQTDSGGTTKLSGGIGLVGTSGWTAGNNATQTADMYFAVRNSTGGISERMRIDSSGNVGIGTTAPGAKLDVAGSLRSYGLTINNTAIVGGANQITIDYLSSSTASRIIAWGANTSTRGTLLFANASSDASSYIEAARIDASGNLGLGVTPSAWAGLTAFQLPDYGTIASKGTNLWTGSNFYYASGTYRYIVAGAATQYTQQSGAHYWFTAPSGTEGNVISFTQAMTLDASGNLGIGTTSPQFRFNAVQGNGSPAPSLREAIQVYAKGYGGSSSYYSGIGFAMSEHTNGYWGSGILARDDTGSYGSALTFYTSSGSATPTPSERARIDSSGNLLVGTTSSSTTTVGWKFLPAVNGSAFVCDTTGDGPTISVTNINATIANGYRWFSFRINSGGTQAGSISYNTGTSQVNYNQTSDRRIKSNIAPALPVLEKMKQVEVVSFDMGQGHTDYGVIAQDLHKLFPEAVSVGDDLDEPETLWGFAGASLVPAMVKAIQELAAKVSALEAKQ